MNTRVSENPQSDIHKYFPEIYANHIDSEKPLFQVSQKLSYQGNSDVMNIQDPENGNLQVLQPGDEITLTGEVIRTRLPVEGSPERVDWVIGHFKGERIRILVKGKEDITQFLNPLDYSSTIPTVVIFAGAANDIVTPN